MALLADKDSQTLTREGYSAFTDADADVADRDWTKISDAKERKRILNRIAQQNYRKRLKSRLEELEQRVARAQQGEENEDAIASSELLESQSCSSETDISDNDDNSVGPSTADIGKGRGYEELLGDDTTATIPETSETGAKASTEPSVRSQPIPDFWRRLCRFLAPPVAPGHERLEWTCECGKLMFGDFRSPSAQLRAQLAEMSRAHESNGKPTSTQALSTPAQAHTRTTSRQQPVGWTSQPYRPSSPTKSEGPDDNGSRNLSYGLQKALWVQVCIKSGRWRTVAKLAQYGQSRSDGDVFQAIRHQYEEARPSFLPLAWRLIQPIRAVFIKFRYDEAPFMSRLSGTEEFPAIPPQEQVMSGRYTYQPCPLDEPPMTSDHFIHYLYAASEHKARVWGPRLPKKSLQTGQPMEPFTETWGVQIYEGLNWALITGLSLLAVVLSGLIAGLVWWKTNDPQTAVAIGTWLTTVQALLLSLVCFMWI